MNQDQTQIQQKKNNNVEEQKVNQQFDPKNQIAQDQMRRENTNPALRFRDELLLQNQRNQDNSHNMIKKPQYQPQFQQQFQQQQNMNIQQSQYNNQINQSQKQSQVNRNISQNNLGLPSQISQNVNNILSRISDNQQLPQYYGQIKKKSRILKMFKNKFIFIHNGYFGYVKSKEDQDKKFIQKHQGFNKRNNESFNVTWKQFKQDFSKSILVFVKIEDLKIEESLNQKQNQYFFEIFFPTSKLIKEQKNIEYMNFHQLESEYISEQQGQAQNNDNLKKDSPNTTIWYFQANSFIQLNEIKKCINDTKNPPNQQQNVEAEQRVRDLEREQREKLEQYKKNQEEGLKILQEERKKMEENERLKKEQQDKEMEELEKKKQEQLQLQKEIEEQNLKKKLENMKIGEKLKTAWNYQWMRSFEENTYQTYQIPKIYQKSSFMIHSQFTFIETCQNQLKEIIFNRAIREDLQTILPLNQNTVKAIDPQLAQLTSQKDSFVKCYHMQNILFQVVFQSGSHQTQIIDLVAKQFKQQFKQYCELTDDIFEILVYDNYFQLRTPQCCLIEYVGCIALCIALENVNLKQLQKNEKVVTLQYDERIKLQLELNPNYKQNLSQEKENLNNNIQQAAQGQTQNKILSQEDEEEKKYEEILNQMMKSEFNVVLTDQNSYKNINCENENDMKEENNRVEVSQVLKSLIYYQKQKNKNYIFDIESSNYLLYMLDDSLYDSFQKFNELIGQVCIYPKHTKTVIIQFRLSLNSPQIRNSLKLLPEKKDFENTFSFNMNNVQSPNQSLMQKLSDIKSQKGVNSNSGLMSSQIQNSNQNENIQNQQFEMVQKEVVMKYFLNDMLNLKLSFLEPSQFRAELKKYGIKCSELFDLVPALQYFQLGLQHTYIQVLSRIIKRQYRQYMNNKIQEFQQSMNSLDSQIQDQKLKIEQINQQLNDLKIQNNQIELELSNLDKQLEQSKKQWQGQDTNISTQIEQMIKNKQQIKIQIEQLTLSMDNERKYLNYLINGDQEDELIQQNGPNKQDIENLSPQVNKEQLLRNKSQSLYSTSFSLKDLEKKNLQKIKLKFEIYLIENIRQFIKQVYFNYNLPDSQVSYWQYFIEPLFQERGIELKKDNIPSGLLLQEICKQIGVESKPSEKIKLFDFQGSTSIIPVKLHAKIKQYVNKQSTIYKLEEDFDKNLSSHLFMVTKSTIDLKYQILNTYNQVIEECKIIPNQENDSKQVEKSLDILQALYAIPKQQSSEKQNRIQLLMEQQILYWEIKQLYEENQYNQIIEYQSEINQKFYPLQIEKCKLLFFLFQILIKTGNIQRAEEIFQQIRKVIDYNYGNESLQLLDYLEELSKFYIKKKQFSQGLDYYLQIESILTNQIGYNHPKTALSSSVIAELYLKIGNKQESIYYYERSLDQYIDFEQNHFNSIISILLKLSELYYEKVDYPRSEDKSQKALQLFYKNKKSQNQNQKDETVDIIFLKLIHISMKLMVETKNFDQKKIQQYSQDFWLICLQVDIYSYHEIIEESLMLCLILNLIEADYKERHYFVDLIKEINEQQSIDENLNQIEEIKQQQETDRINVQFSLFQQEIKANPLIGQLITTILRVYLREISQIKPYFDIKTYLQNENNFEHISKYPQMLNKVIQFAEIFTHVMGQDNCELFLSFDYDFQNFL